MAATITFRKIPQNRLAAVFCVFFLPGFLLSVFSCSKAAKRASDSQTPAVNEAITGDREAFIDDYWHWAFGDAGLPEVLARKAVDSLTQGPDFVMELLDIIKEDHYLYMLVDKSHALQDDYAPSDLVELTGKSYKAARAGLMLRRSAEAALENMAAAARADGVILTAASAYRSFDYQTEVYNRNVREMGREAADRESAMPGHSQHQLGLVVDFYPIDDAFAETPAGIWMQKNASRFGWSISYPIDCEAITGYRWESWHYRYTGPELASFIDKYFDGIQQYALQFIRAWIESS
ncbi:MAG: M15 family metallopeptidase [Treponema sp.]|jgi:D-alanyl-D-alanine carboxypeptidase|nr:M15 family metallopeptidase [Treponema sp.]